jgi:Ca2+-binding RTX toxin-like protein
VSTIIQPVTPVTADTSVQPPAGTTTSATSGQSLAVTDSSGTAVIEAPATGTFKVASATSGADVVIAGKGTAGVVIGTSVDSAGNPLSGSGTSFQISDTYQGSAVVNLDNAIVDGTKINPSTETFNGSIGANLPGGTSSNAFAGPTDIDYYINTGSANDQVEGSKGNDFIRLGAGNDTFNAGAGDDIVRTGSGNDSGTLGAGEDILYLTVDQLQGSQTKTITDFDANGNDKIQIDSDLKDLVTIEGQGTNAIKITLSGAQTGTTAVISEGQTIDNDDIEFV